MGVFVVLVAVVALLVATGAGTPLRDAVDVTIVRSEDDELEAVAAWGDESMEINAKVNRLSIQSNTGGLLIYGEKIEGSGTFYSAQGQSFFSTETQDSDGTLRKTEYAVPSSMEAEAKEAFQEKKIQRMVGSFDQRSARRFSEEAIRGLVERPEVKVLEEAARVLGERGVVGAENDGALLFYMTVMNLMRGREEDTSKRSTERERHSRKPLGRGYRSLETETVREKVVEVSYQPDKVLCPSVPEKTETISDSIRPTISPSPSVKFDRFPKCTEVIKTVVSIDRGFFWGGTTETKTYTYTICPTSTVSLKSTATSNPCTASSPGPKTSSVPCPSPAPADYDPPSNNTLDYHPYSSDRCAIPLPPGVHPCQEDHSWTLLCENCHHDYECRRGRCPFEDECLGMCGRRCSCWSWACGDCCFWKGCYQHDKKCGESFFSFACLLPFGFDCNGYL